MHFVRMLAAQVGVREARIGEPIRATHEARQGFELRLLHDTQRHLAPVGTHEHTRGGLAAVADVASARQTPACHQVRNDGGCHESNGRIEHRDVDELASARALSAQQRREYREGRRLASERVDDWKSDPHGIVSLLTAQ